MSTSLNDTIVAPATPMGRSALAVVRIDGPRTIEVVEHLTAGRVLKERVATHVTLKSGGVLLDDAVVTQYVGPRSFTGNDLAELSLHGNPFLVDELLRAVIDLGGRMAEPGEFTERAVLNGKLDLLQAEAILDLIEARTAVQSRLSLLHLGGELSSVAFRLRDGLLYVIARLEAALDFSEDGYEFITREEAAERLGEAGREIAALVDTFVRGRATTAGLTAVLLGQPNAGKSTLLNRLVGTDRAIVTAIPGTTRDLLRETMEIGGLPVTFVDTAGLRQSLDPVEAEGIARARAAARSAELVLYLVDSATGLTTIDREEIDRYGDRCRVVYTKTDIAPTPEGQSGISAKNGAGMAELMLELDKVVRASFAVPEGAPSIVNERQRAALDRALVSVRGAVEALRSGANEEIVLVELYTAARSLASMIGAIVSEDIQHEIFSRFCIGK